jgi:predicted Zn finger-like uncharacterized protein
MPANAKIKTACPVCGAKYKVAESKVGHAARCSRCKTKFRVIEYTHRHKHRPTEEDILKWLNEGTEEPDYLIAPTPSCVEAPVARPETDPKTRPAADTDIRTKPAASSSNRLRESVSEPADPLQFRKTG